MNNKNNFQKFERYEFKYILNKQNRDLIENEITHFMKIDKFANKDNKYFVRSLYFDDKDSTEYYKKIDGMLSRQKYRLRTYGKIYNDKTPIFLEIKGRNNQRTYKKRKTITYDELNKYEDCNNLKVSQKYFNDEIEENFFFQVFRRNLLPTVITDYWRAPYVSDYDSNFRLTFDSLISVKKSSKLFNNLNNFERKCLAGYSILEIKFNRRIPKWFHRIIQNYNLRRISVSKFCLGMEITDIAVNLE